MPEIDPASGGVETPRERALRWLLERQAAQLDELQSQSQQLDLRRKIEIELAEIDEMGASAGLLLVVLVPIALLLATPLHSDIAYAVALFAALVLAFVLSGLASLADYSESPFLRRDRLRAILKGRRPALEYTPPLPPTGLIAMDSPARRGGSRSRIVSGMTWMLLLSLLLFWLPIIGSLLAGIVGGKKAGGVGPAIAAVVLPAFLFASLLYLLASSLVAVPVLGAVLGLVGGALWLTHSGFLFVGALIGGLLA